RERERERETEMERDGEREREREPRPVYFLQARCAPSRARSVRGCLLLYVSLLSLKFRRAAEATSHGLSGTSCGPCALLLAGALLTFTSHHCSCAGRHSGQ